jgi:hypothetical protein
MSQYLSVVTGSNSLSPSSRLIGFPSSVMVVLLQAPSTTKQQAASSKQGEQEEERKKCHEKTLS